MMSNMILDLGILDRLVIGIVAGHYVCENGISVVKIMENVCLEALAVYQKKLGGEVAMVEKVG